MLGAAVLNKRARTLGQDHTQVGSKASVLSQDSALLQHKPVLQSGRSPRGEAQPGLSVSHLAGNCRLRTTEHASKNLY